MRRLPAGLAISAAVHVAAVAWVSVQDAAPPPRAPAAPAVAVEVVDVPARRPETAALQVAFLDERTTASVPDLSQPARVAVTRPRHRELAASGAATAPPPGVAPEPGAPPARNPLLDMRKGAPVRLGVGVPTGSWDGRETPRETYGPDLDSGRLAPAGGGRYRSNEGVFTAKVDRDGSVSLKDAKNLQVHFGIPTPKKLVRGIGRMIGDWYQDDNKAVGMLGPMPDHKPPRLNRDRAEDKDTRPDHGGTVPIVGGSFDLTDALMRRNGQDPYASKKLDYLDSTRDQRVQIGMRHRQQQLEHAPQLMQQNLDRLWATVADPAARREALFELWDDCAETGSEDLVSAGRAARKLVVGAIRARFPAGSATAYAADELAAFNRRKVSTARFAPYD